MCIDFYSFHQLCPSAYTQALNKGKNPRVLVVPTSAGGPQIPEMEETSEADMAQTLMPEKSTAHITQLWVLNSFELSYHITEKIVERIS